MRFERVTHGRMNAFIALLLSFCVLATGMIVRPKTAHAANDVTVNIEMNTSGSYQWAGQTKTFNNTRYQLVIFNNDNYTLPQNFMYLSNKTVFVSPHGTLNTRQYAPDVTKISDDWRRYYGVRDTSKSLQTNIEAWLIRKIGETEWTVIPPTRATIPINAEGGETVELTPLVSFTSCADAHLTVQPVVNPLTEITFDSRGGVWKDSTGGTSVRTIGQPVLLSTPTNGGSMSYSDWAQGHMQYSSPHLGLPLTNQPDPSTFMPGGSAAPVLTTTTHQQIKALGWSLDETPTASSRLYTSWAQLKSAFPDNQIRRAYAYYALGLSFDANGGNSDADKTITAPACENGNSSACIIRSSQLKSVIPSRDHYRFIGWNSKPDGSGTQLNVNNDRHLDNNETWYAQWEQVDNKLTFNTNGGHFSTSATDTTSVIWSAPHTYVPSRDLRAVVPVHDAASDGYAMVFNGWNSKADGTGSSLNTALSHQLNSDETWYAQWEKSNLAIIFDATPGTFSNGSSTETHPANASGVVTSITSTPQPEKIDSSGNHYYVSDWTTKQNGQGLHLKDFQDSRGITIAQPVTFYPVWKRSSVLTIQAGSLSDPFSSKTFSDGQETVKVYGRPGQTVDISSYYNDLKSRYSDLIAFHDIGFGSGTDEFSKSYITSYTFWIGDGHIYPFYKGDARIDEVQIFPLGVNYAPFDPTTENTYKSQLSNPAAGNSNCYSWSTFSDAQFMCRLPVNLDSVVPSLSGHEFLGYSRVGQNTSSTSRNIDNLQLMPPYSDLAENYFDPRVDSSQSKLYGWWGHWLYLNANGGKWEHDQSTSKQIPTDPDGKMSYDIITNSLFTDYSGDVVPVRPGYTFRGWYNGNDRLPTGSFYLTSDTTYYAKWIHDPVMRFDPNGGSFNGLTTPLRLLSNSSKIVTRSQISTVPTPTRTLSHGTARFDGWYSEKVGGTRLDTSQDHQLGNDDETWYAHWTLPTDTITLDGNGGTVRRLTGISSSSTNPTWASMGSRTNVGEDDDNPLTAGTEDNSNIPLFSSTSNLYKGGTFTATRDPSGLMTLADGSHGQQMYNFVGWSQSQHEALTSSALPTDIVPLPQTKTDGAIWAPSSTLTTLFATWRATTFDLNDAIRYTESHTSSTRTYSATLKPDTTGRSLFPKAVRPGFVLEYLYQQDSSGNHTAVCYPYDYDSSTTHEHQCHIDDAHMGTWYAQWAPMKLKVNYRDKVLASGEDATRDTFAASGSASTASFDPRTGKFSPITLPAISYPSGVENLYKSVVYPEGWAEYGFAGPVRPDYTYNRVSDYQNTVSQNLVRSYQIGDSAEISLSSLGHNGTLTLDDTHRDVESVAPEFTFYVLWGVRVRSLPQAGGDTSRLAIAVGAVLALVLIGVDIIRRTGSVYGSSSTHGRHAL